VSRASRVLQFMIPSGCGAVCGVRAWVIVRRLHPDLQLLAEPGRTVVPQPHRQSPAARGLPLRPRPHFLHRGLPAGQQQRPQAIHLDRQRRRDPGQGPPRPRRPRSSRQLILRHCTSGIGVLDEPLADIGSAAGEGHLYARRHHDVDRLEVEGDLTECRPPCATSSSSCARTSSPPPTSTASLPVSSWPSPDRSACCSASLHTNPCPRRKMSSCVRQDHVSCSG